MNSGWRMGSWVQRLGLGLHSNTARCVHDPLFVRRSVDLYNHLRSPGGAGFRSRCSVCPVGFNPSWFRHLQVIRYPSLHKCHRVGSGRTLQVRLWFSKSSTRSITALACFSRVWTWISRTGGPVFGCSGSQRLQLISLLCNGGQNRVSFGMYKLCEAGGTTVQNLDSIGSAQLPPSQPTSYSPDWRASCHPGCEF